MVRQQQQPTVLIAGNYTHDVLIKDDVVLASTLGGAASFISTVHHALSTSSPLNHFISKVGPDFSFSHSLLHSPILSPTNTPTTLFHALFSSDPARPDRSLTRVHSCDPILPSDIPNTRHTFAMAVGVGGEILPETLEKMISLCDVVFVDIQALIRVFDDKGMVSLIDLKDSGFYHLLPRIGFLKASAEETAFMEVEEVRKMCNVVVTNGEEGCVVYFKGGGGGEEGVKVMPFEAVQVDPTGAGDSFLGGLVGGLVLGLGVVDAALLGNFFGAWTVGFLGIPKVDFRLFERVREEVQRRKLQYTSHGERLDGEKQFMKPLGHEQFHAALTAAKLMSTNPIQELQRNLPNSPRAIQHGCDLQYAGQQKSYNTVYEEPIQTIEPKP